MYDIEHMPSSIDIGYTAEHQFRTIEIDMTGWIEKMPNGVPSIVHVRPGETEEEAYIAATTFENNILIWTISDSDIGDHEGTGLAQIWLEETANDSLVKLGMSAVVATLVHQSLSTSPTPVQQLPWLAQMLALKTQSMEAASDSEAFAVGKRGGVDVGQGDETWHNNSKWYANAAEQAAIGKGYMYVYIDENTGHLIYNATNDVNIDLEIEDGRLNAIWE